MCFLHNIIEKRWTWFSISVSWKEELGADEYVQYNLNGPRLVSRSISLMDNMKNWDFSNDDHRKHNTQDLSSGNAKFFR